MKSLTTFTPCVCVLVFALCFPASAASPAQTNLAPVNPPAPAPAEAPQLPATTAPATPPGPNNSGPTLMTQDLMTGDWGGFRKDLINHGVTLTPTYTGEVFGNPSGGARKGVIADGLINVALDLNLGRMNDAPIFEDTLIHTEGLYVYGSSLSGSFVGDFSTTSNIAAYNSVRLQELWLQKLFWDKRLSLKIGNMSVDDEYFQSNSASLFINGTFGAFTLISLDVQEPPVYPTASPGVRLEFLPTSSFYVMAGVYGMDNGSDPETNNKNGTRFALNGASGMLVMSEAGYLLNQSPNDRGLQGTYRLGSFVHTTNYTTFHSQANFANGTGSLQSAGTNYGIYGVMDQQIYAQGSQGISLFVRSGGAPSNTNFVDFYAEGGFNFTGFLPGRDNDVAGIAVARSHVSRDFGNAQIAQGGTPFTAETVIEGTYKVQLAPWWSVQPDVQYIVTPSGAQFSHNATVIGLRTNIAF